MDTYTILAGSGNTPLALAIGEELGIALAPCAIARYPDGEIAVEIETSVRGHDVYVIQPTSPPVNDNLVELLALVDACRRASAARITAVMPYVGYARSDKREGKRRPVMGSTVAMLMEAVGIAHVLTLDVHAPQLEGFFHVPIDNLTAVGPLCGALHHRLPDDAVVVAPDLGGARLASEYGQRLGLPTAICRKRRITGSDVDVGQVIGDVAGRRCLIVDDMITTGGTMAACARALARAGAQPEPLAAATHGVFAPGAMERLAAAGVHDVVVTDSIAPAPSWGSARVVGVAPLLAAALRRLITDASLGAIA